MTSIRALLSIATILVSITVVILLQLLLFIPQASAKECNNTTNQNNNNDGKYNCASQKTSNKRHNTADPLIMPVPFPSCFLLEGV